MIENVNKWYESGNKMLDLTLLLPSLSEKSQSQWKRLERNIKNAETKTLRLV